jgi:hypothetical protein
MQGVGYYVCTDFGRLVVSGGNIGPVSPKGHWLVHGPMDYSATDNRCFEYGGQKRLFKAGIDSSFGSRGSVCQQLVLSTTKDQRNPVQNEPQERPSG